MKQLPKKLLWLLLPAALLLAAGLYLLLRPKAAPGGNYAERVDSVAQYESHWMSQFENKDGLISHLGHSAGYAVFCADGSKGMVVSDTGLYYYDGTEDGVLNMDRVEEASRFGAVETAVIEGGNHANFGNYGEQAGDKAAAISAEEQQEEDGQPEEYLLTEQILKSVSGLPVLEQECFIAYYGLDGTTPRRANDIAMQYGITEEAVKQCISHALEQMRAAGLDTDFFEV